MSPKESDLDEIPEKDQKLITSMFKELKENTNKLLNGFQKGTITLIK